MIETPGQSLDFGDQRPRTTHVVWRTSSMPPYDCVYWFNNARPHVEIGMVPPVELEANPSIGRRHQLNWRPHGRQSL